MRAHRICLDRRFRGALLAALVPACAWCDEPFGIAESLAQGRFTLELRPRYNRIDESGKPLRAEGFTGRAILGWRSAPFAGFRLTLQAIHTGQWRKEFNDDPARRAASPYPLLPDPRHTGLNEAHVEYAGAEGLRLRLGRQVVRVDNQRWISDNDFRQVPQLFDGALARYAPGASAQLTAGYFPRLRGTGGGTEKLKLTILHAAWNPLPGHALGAYAYLHDQPDSGAFTGFANNSNRVVGVRAEGAAWRFAAVDVPYVAEYAQQRPHAGGDARIDASYWRAGAGLAGRDWSVRYDYEVKGSNRGLYGLQMPLTDFYAFNGWTLHFFNTPRYGLRDRWLTLRYSLGNFTLYGESHRFKTDFARVGLGRENDVGLTYAITADLLLRLQHARYDPGTGTPDPSIRKTWLTLTFTH